MTHRERLIAFLASLCLFLAAVEYAVPKPLPFMRLGLANLPLIITLPLLKKRETLLLAVLKVLTQALISGTLLSYVFLFSVGGTFSSVLVMMLLYGALVKIPQEKGKKGLVSVLGITVAGSLANNLAQLVLARFFLFGDAARYVAPLLLGTGLISGLLLGIFCLVFVKKSAWYERLEAEL